MADEPDTSLRAGENRDFEHAYWRSASKVDRHLPELSPGRISDEEFRLLADSLPTLCWVANGDGYIVWYNRCWHEYCGTTPEEMEGWGWQKVHDPKLLPRVMERWTRSIATGEPFEMIFPLKGADGIYRPFLTRIQPVRDESGNIVRWFGVNTEISAQNEAEEALRQSEEQLRLVLDSAPGGLYTVDCDGYTRMVSRGFVDMMGFADESEALGRKLHDLIHHTKPDGSHYPVEECPIYRCASTGQSAYVKDELLFRLDGTPLPVEYWVAPVFSGERQVGATCTIVDISERKQAEETVRETSRRLDAILNNTKMAVFMMDDRQHCVFMNKAAEELTGYSFAETQGRPLHDVVHHKYPDGRHYPIEECPIDRALPEDDQVQGEELFVHKDGHFYPVGFTASPIRDDSGTPIGTVIEARNIADEKERDAAIRDSEVRFRSVFENAAVGMLELDSEWRILGANAAYSRITGFQLDELLGRSSLSFTHPDDVEASEAALRRLAADSSSEQISFDKRYIRQDGRVVWVRSNISRISGSGEDARFLKVIEDTTAVHEARQSREEQSRVLETLNRTGTAVAAELDLQKVVQLVTDAGVELVGAQFGAFFYNVPTDDEGGAYMLYTLSGAEPSQFDFGMPRSTAVFHPTFAGEGIIRSEDITKDPRYGKNPPHKGMPKGHLPVRSYLAVPVVSRSGEVIGGLFFGHPKPGQFTESHEMLMLGLAAQAATSIDNARLYQAVQRANETLEQRVQERTAELEKANEALRQAQKMEAIGQLTGGIAHDFNNMLTVIRGSADVLQRPELAEKKRERYVDAIAETADRAARLTGQLLAFARRQALKPEIFDAVQRVESISDMMRTVLGSRIRLAIEPECDNCLVEADAAQFETALVNMAVNARDAMSGEGALTIRIDRSEKLPAGLQAQSSASYVAVSVSDTGHGIAKDDLGKIFEPFFTTKEVGRGTGLGLSQVYGFAKQSGGELGVESEVGKGSTFTLYLPEADGSIAIEDDSDEAIPELQPGRRILVVEDNEEVGRFAEQVLAELGLETRRAANAAEALELLEKDGGFDLVFSDVVMPGMSGIDFAREAQKRWPHLPVILTSGYSDVLTSRANLEFPLLQKPYSLEGLQKAVAEAMHR